MSLAEIKDSIGALSVEERLDLAAWIAHLNHADDPAYIPGGIESANGFDGVKANTTRPRQHSCPSLTAGKWRIRLEHEHGKSAAKVGRWVPTFLFEDI